MEQFLKPALHREAENQVQKQSFCRFAQYTRSFMVCAAVGIGLSSGAVYAQKTPPPSPPFSAQDAAVLSQVGSAMSYAAKRAGVALVPEGEPFKKTLTPSELQEINTHVPPKELLAQIALAYDYDAEPQKEGLVVVLRKRYTDPDDLPFITMAEADAVLRDMSRLIAALSPPNPDSNADQHSALGEFAASLSPEQQAAMANPKEGLAIGKLSPLQKDRLWQVPLSVYAQRPDSLIRQIKKQVVGTSDPQTAIGREGTDAARNISWFGYAVFVPGAVKNRRFRAMNMTNSAIGNSFSIRNSPEDNDQTVPKVARPIDGEEKQGETPLAISLREAVRQTRSRAPDDVLPVVVAEEVAEKPVVLINASTAPPQTLLRALTETYGLLLVKQVDGVQYLGRPRLPKVKTFADLPQALQALMPLPFMRALQWQDDRILDEQVRLARQGLSDYRLKRFSTPAATTKAGSGSFPSPAADAAEGAALEKELARRIKQKEKNTKRPEDLRWAAVRHLRTVVEPRLKSEGKPMVLIASLGGMEKAALADFFLTDLWLAVSARITNPTPSYITHFDDGFVFGNPVSLPPGSPDNSGSKERQGFTVSFGYLDGDRKLRDAGLTYTTYAMPKK